MTHRTRKPMLFAADQNHHPVQIPFVTDWQAISADRFGILTSELPHPKVNSLMADDDSAFGQQILNVTQALAETEVQPTYIFDDFWRKAPSPFKQRQFLRLVKPGV